MDGNETLSENETEECGIGVCPGNQNTKVFHRIIETLLEMEENFER